MMKIILSSLMAALGAVSVYGAPELATLPIQTFFVPFTEDDIFRNMFFQINSGRATAPVVSTISMAFSTSGTVIWYDHWEDGYDIDVTNATSPTTEIWGDGIAANGCVPKTICTDATDFIKSGQSVVINSTVPIPRDKSVILYDGSDRLQTSFPITITRGAYPTVPGSLMAGATDVIEVENWGKKFESPTGGDVGTVWSVFEYTGLFFMAANDNTTVTLPNMTKIVLNRGGSGSVLVNQGALLEADDVIQVHIITGDKMSYYEMRWYSLLPFENWSNEYLSPVGDTHGKTKMFVYNPGTTTMDIAWDYLEITTTATTKKTITRSIPAKKSTWTDVIPSGSGALVKSVNGGKFVALSLTDTENRTSVGQLTFSEWYDWGFTVLPTNILTHQVLIGWGYACTNKNCFGAKDRSVVWVTPVADCDIYIDYNNTGTNVAVFPRKALTSSKFIDIDQDMSGALLFATMPNTGIGGKPVNIAAAWGQDPSVSKEQQSISLDLGTVIRPFPSVRATKSVDKAEAKPGDMLTYTIQLQNSGQVDLPGRSLVVFDTLDKMVSYVPGTTTITYDVVGGKVLATKVPDGTSGTPFPLDESGYTVLNALAKRGGAMDITFNVSINGPLNSMVVVNNGEVKQPFGSNIVFDATTKLLLDPRIALDNKVYLGSNNGEFCGTDEAKEYVEDIAGAGVIYCFNVTNTGNTYLTNFTLDDVALVHKNSSKVLLAPGNSTMLFFRSKINVPLKNMANVTGTPAFMSGAKIDGLPEVIASDPSEVGVLIAAPNVSIDNKVFLGTDGALCGTELPSDYVEQFAGAIVTYCFNVTNTGNTFLDSVAIVNKELVFTNSSTGKLAPGESRMVVVPGTIEKKLLNNATVVANPIFKDGTDIPSLADVTDTDPSEVGLLLLSPNITIENTVYLGNEVGLCKTAVELVKGKNLSDVTFCFLITNTGDSYLSITSLVDPLVAYSGSNLGILAPGQSITVPHNSKINGDVINDATVVANPVTKEGKDIPNLVDVTDTDPSEVKALNDGTPREFFNPPEPPGGNKTCMDNSYADAHNKSDQLVCTTKEVYLEQVDSIVAKTCEAGQMINVDVDGSMYFNSARFDLGWYVATDGGDALDGSCVVNGLQQRAAYDVVESPGSKNITGTVNWGKDAKGAADACGDIVTTKAGADGNIDTPIMVNLPVLCEDENKDGQMDVAICFTWRTDATDDVCTIERADLLTKGSLADMFPGDVKGCYCERYDLPNITVVPPPVLPC